MLGLRPPPSHARPPDLLILANCVYYESSLEPLLDTLLGLAGRATLVLACYEERTTEIKGLIARWHALVQQHFDREDVPAALIHPSFAALGYVRLVTYRRRAGTTTDNA